MNITWWCSAQGLPWTGEWQAYPGVWLFVLAVGALLWRWRWRWRESGGGYDAGSRFDWRRASLLSGVALLWITLDWPVGPLGAGYLAWVHSVQFLMLAMFIPPLLLAGLDRARISRALRNNAAVAALVRRVTQPLFAMIVFAVTMVLTHLPNVVDALMATQIGAFALDAAWLGAGTLFWWPVIVREPERPHFPPLIQMLYLFFGTQPHLYIAMWLLGADYPAYGTYELAPRVMSLPAITDQQIAGAVMLGFGGTYVLAVISVVFFRWMRRVEQ